MTKNLHEVVSKYLNSNILLKLHTTRVFFGGIEGWGGGVISSISDIVQFDLINSTKCH